MHWHPADCDNLAAPAKAFAVLDRAIALNEDSAVLRAKRADLHFDQYDYAAAAGEYFAALRLAPDLQVPRAKLARCLNVGGEHQQALDILAAAAPAPQFERAMALLALGQVPQAEAEFRAVLAVEPPHRRACKELCRILRKSNRLDAVLDLCGTLHRLGVDHGQLFYEWGRALALTGDYDAARALLFDRNRIYRRTLPVPAGFPTLEAFNEALAEELLGNANQLTSFPPGEEANRGSSRVHSLFAGQRPDMIRALLDTIQQAVSEFDVPATGSFDPWPAARPVEAHLRPWGLIQRGDAYEEWHHHRGGWLSGVYYVRVPASVTDEGDGPGCIEFGLPPSLHEAMPDFIPRWRYRPRAGTLLLSPSHYAHRTIPTGADSHRISFAFDVVARGAATTGAATSVTAQGTGRG